jgi:hypothetical protein
MNPTTLMINNCRTAVISRTTPLLQRRAPRVCPSARKNSGRYKPEKDSCTGGITHGPAHRVDRVYSTSWLLPAVVDVEVVDMTGQSDHHTVVVTYDLDTVIDLYRARFALTA